MPQTLEVTKDPAAVLDWHFDWSEWLTAVDDTIASYTVTAETGITVASHSIDGDVVTVWLSGGTAGRRYTVTCQITCSVVNPVARKDERSIQIAVRQR